MGTTQNKSSCKTAAEERKSDVQIPPGGFVSAEMVDRQDEGRLNELARCIRERDREDQQLANVMLAHAVEKGRWLTEAKAMVPYGEWGNWLKEKVDYSQSKAQGLMKLYQKFGDEQESLFGPSKSQALGNLSVTKALMLIDIPDEELGEVMESYDLESMTTREVAALKKELADAKGQAEQAKAGQSAAEQAREKISKDMALANERIAGLNAEVEELRSRPVEVAVEADAAAIEAARKEAEAAMKDKLDKAKAAQKKTRADLMEANSALQRAKLEREQVESELRNKLAKAEKKASLASNEDFVLFYTIFSLIQECGNKGLGVLLRMRNRDPKQAEGCSKAYLDWLGKMKEAVEQ